MRFDPAVRPPVRAHVARVVDRARVVMLDVDGVMFDVEAAARRAASEASNRALSALLRRDDAISRLVRSAPVKLPPSLSAFDWSVTERLTLLAAHEPELAAEADPLVAAAELHALAAASPQRGLAAVLTACRDTDRPVVAVSGLSLTAVRAAIDAHGLAGHLAAVVARDGADPTSVQTAPALASAARSLNVPAEACLLVSGTFAQLSAAHDGGVPTIGCACGRDRYARLVWEWSPAVPNHARLVDALLHRTAPTGGDCG